MRWENRLRLITSARYAGWVMFACLFAGAIGLSALSWAKSPILGIELTQSGDRVLVARVDIGSDAHAIGVLPGDHLVDINGSAAAPGDLELREARSLTFKSAAGGSSRVIRFDSRYGALAGLVALEVIAVSFAVVGTAVAIRPGRSTTAGTFARFAIASAITLAIAPAAVANHTVARVVEGMAATLASANFCLLASSMGSEAWRRPRLQFLLPQVACTAGIPVIVGLLLAGGVMLGFPTYPAGRVLTLVAVVCGIGGGLAILIWRYVRSLGTVGREQVRIALLGSALALAPFISLSMLPNLLMDDYVIEPEITALAAVFIPVSFAYAITRYQLLGIRRLVHRAVAYSVFTAGVLFLYALMVWLLSVRIESDSARHVFEFVFLIALIAGAPLVASANGLASRVTDRLLYRYDPDFDQVLRDLSMQGIAAGESDQFIEFLIAKGLDTLRLESAAYVHASADGRSGVIARTGTVSEPMLEIALLEARSHSTHEARPILPLLGEGLFLLIPVTDFPEAGEKRFLLAGPKLSGEGFSRKEIEFLKGVCALLRSTELRARQTEELERQRAEALETLRNLQGASERVKAEIADYLHDEPLQKVTFVLARLRESAVSQDLTAILQQVTSDLRQTSSSLGNGTLRDLGLVRACEWAVTHVGGRGNARTFYHTDGIAPDARFNRDVEDAAYRVVLEGMNNIVKHSRASAAWVEIAIVDGRLRVQIEDNGIGLEATAATAAAEVRPHLGIASLRRQVTQAGGRLEVGPRAARGTRVVAEIPIAAAHPAVPPMAKTPAEV